MSSEYQELLEKLLNSDTTDVIPQSRAEYIMLTAINSLGIDTLPEPDSRMEAYLMALITKMGEGGSGGDAPFIGANGNWYVGQTDTGVAATGQDGKTAYQYAVEGGYTGNEEAFAAKLAQEKFANPNALTFTGAVSGSYDGSAPLEVAIPSGGGEWELIIDTTFTEAAGLDTGELPGKTKMMCVFAAPKGDAAVSLYASSKAFGKSLNGLAVVSATYGKIGFIFAEKLYENSIVYFGSGDTTSTTPDLDTTARINVTTMYNRITTNITDVPLKIAQELPAGTIIKVFVQ